MRKTNLILAAALAGGSLIWTGTTFAQQQPVRDDQRVVRPEDRGPADNTNVTNSDPTRASGDVRTDVKTDTGVTATDSQSPVNNPPLVRDPNQPVRSPDLNVSGTTSTGTGQSGTITGDAVGVEPRTNDANVTPGTPDNPGAITPNPNLPSASNGTLTPSNTNSGTSADNAVNASGSIDSRTPVNNPGVTSPGARNGSIDAGSGITGPGIGQTNTPANPNTPNVTGSNRGTTTGNNSSGLGTFRSNESVVGGQGNVAPDGSTAGGAPNSPRIDASGAPNSPDVGQTGAPGSTGNSTGNTSGNTGSSSTGGATGSGATGGGSTGGSTGGGK